MFVGASVFFLEKLRRFSFVLGRILFMVLSNKNIIVPTAILTHTIPPISINYVYLSFDEIDQCNLYNA